MADLVPVPSTIPITMTLPIGIKSISATFWMRPFETETHIKKYKINPPYSAIYMQLVKPYDPNMPKDAFMSLSFPITEYNLPDIKNLFAEALSWFTPANIKLLYGTNDEGTLLFNNEYKDLRALYTNDFSAVKTSIKIVPSIHEDAYNKYSPAVLLFINRVENYVLLREYEFKKFAQFIMGFNFIQYNQYAMQCLQHCANSGSLLSVEETKKRLMQNRQFDSSSRF